MIPNQLVSTMHNHQSTITYVEDGQQYKEIPKWVRSCIHLGYTWKVKTNPWKRRIGVVSMPCKSVGAPLIALGSLISDLEREDANNINGHYEALCRARDAYLENEADSNGFVINSQGKKHKFSGQVGSEEISVVVANYKEKVKKNGRLVTNPHGPCISFITENNAKDWRLYGEPVIETTKVDKTLNKNDYQFIDDVGCSILSDNLQRSYTGLLLVGDGEGLESNYMKSIYDISFSKDEYKNKLGKLLTLHSSSNEVTRITFCNKQHIDRQSREHYLVIADGASSFVKALSYFKNSDVIGVYSRDEPSDNLLNITSMLGELGRYYTDDKNSYFPSCLPNSIASLFMVWR